MAKPSRCLLLAAFLIFFAGASAHAEKTQDYFPKGLFGDFEVNEWWGPDLVAMGEPSLYQLARKDSSAEVYRCTFFPPYDDVVSIQLTRRADGTALLELHKLSQEPYQGGYVPGKITRHARYIVSKHGMDRFLALLDQWSFWTQPATIKDPDDACLGGSEWLYEGVRRGNYHAVARGDCYNKNCPARLPGVWLLKLMNEW